MGVTGENLSEKKQSRSSTMMFRIYGIYLTDFDFNHRIKLTIVILLGYELVFSKCAGERVARSMTEPLLRNRSKEMNLEENRPQ